MGGLWEAAVKSIEAVLNSRPISPQSDLSTELSPLTPGYFLRRGPLMAALELPSENLSVMEKVKST